MGNSNIINKSDDYPYKNYNYFKDKTKNIIILTTPHSFCKKSSVRTCDVKASKFLSILSKHLREIKQKDREWSIKTFASNTFRDKVDLNRMSGRYSDFRPMLRDFIEKNTKNIFMVIDLHSFPEDYDGFGEKVHLSILDDTSYLNVKEWSNEETPMMQQHQTFPLYVIKLQEILDKANIATSITPGSINDIQNEVRTKWNIPSVLLEANEGLEDENFIKISVCIGEWFSVLTNNKG